MRAGRRAQPHDSGNNTTHFAVIDAEGNAVSNSYTMNLRYGSKWAVAGAGFLLNGSVDSFAFIEGTGELLRRPRQPSRTCSPRASGRPATWPRSW